MLCLNERVAVAASKLLIRILFTWTLFCKINGSWVAASFLGNQQDEQPLFWFPPDAECKPGQGRVVEVPGHQYKCECEQCHWGAHCENLKCLNGGNIRKTWRGYTECDCIPEFAGKCCNEQRCFGKWDVEGNRCRCLRPDRQRGIRCELATCDNGGTPDGKGGCNCLPHFNGQFCEITLCLNGGQFLHDEQRCACPFRTAGTHCQVLECLNGGTSVSSSGNCECPSKFSGQFCEHIECVHGKERPGSCLCEDERFSGQHCEVVKCENGGIPSIKPGAVCDCPDHELFEGRFCERVSPLLYILLGVAVSLLSLLGCLCCRCYCCKNRFKRLKHNDAVKNPNEKEHFQLTEDHLKLSVMSVEPYFLPHRGVPV